MGMLTPWSRKSSSVEVIGTRLSKCTPRSRHARVMMCTWNDPAFSEALGQLALSVCFWGFPTDWRRKGLHCVLVKSRNLLSYIICQSELFNMKPSFPDGSMYKVIYLPSLQFAKSVVKQKIFKCEKFTSDIPSIWRLCIPCLLIFRDCPPFALYNPCQVIYTHREI